MTLSDHLVDPVYGTDLVICKGFGHMQRRLVKIVNFDFTSLEFLLLINFEIASPTPIFETAKEKYSSML